MSGPVVNPYAPPAADEGIEQGSGWFEYDDEGPRLASLSARFWGAMADNLLFVAVALVTYLVFVLLDNNVEAAAVVGLALAVPLAGYQCYLVSVLGQSLGKRLVKTRVVRLDGSPPGFLHGVVLRTFVLALFGAVPVIGRLVGGIDAGFVFRKDRRALHDHLAGTRVIRA